MNSTTVEDPSVGPSGAVKEISRITAACVVFWFVLAGPAWLAVGDQALIGLTVAAGLCWFPACLVQPFRVLLAIPADLFSLVAGGVRLVFVLTAALVAKYRFPEFGIPEFFAWLILFYLFTLAAETWFAMKGQKSADQTQIDSRD